MATFPLKHIELCLEEFPDESGSTYGIEMVLHYEMPKTGDPFVPDGIVSLGNWPCEGYGNGLQWGMDDCIGQYSEVAEVLGIPLLTNSCWDRMYVNQP